MRRRPLCGLIVYAERIVIGGAGGAIREAVEGPVAETGADLLVDVLRLADAIDGDIAIGKDEGSEVLGLADDMFFNQHLDAFFQHRAVFGGLFALRLFVVYIVAVAGAAIAITLLLHPLLLFLPLVLLFLDPVALFLHTFLPLLLLFLDPIPLLLFMIALLLYPVLPLMLHVAALLRTVPYLLLAVALMLLAVVFGLALIALGLAPVPLHLAHLPLFVIVFHRRLYPFDNSVVFGELVTGEEAIIHVNFRRLIKDIHDLKVMIADVRGEDVLSHGGEEDVIAVPDAIGRVVLAFDKGG